MRDVLTILEPVLERTIHTLNKKAFKADPIAGAHFSRIASLLSSSYKRHGYILERALLESVKQIPGLQAWRDEKFQISQAADMLVASGVAAPDAHVLYTPGQRSIQVDAIVYREADRSITSYEVKRAFGYHDSGKRRSMLRDASCTKVLLRDYARQRGLDPLSTGCHIVFYYGKMSVPPPIGLSRDMLDMHFGGSVVEEIEKVNARFRERLFQILSA
jgi:hypothetical protein